MIDKPKQAVILAGGIGTRLSPLTKDFAKPMINICGKPFLEHIVLFLKKNNFKKILFVVGYKNKSISNYFGDGKKWNLSFSYNITPDHYKTGLRIKNARSQIEENFFLLYCDNYCQLNLGEMWNNFKERKNPIMITVYKDFENKIKNNINLNSNGIVTSYDKERKTKKKFLDIGFMFLKKEVILGLTTKNISFEDYLFKNFLKKNQISAFITYQKYFSIGSLSRLKETNEFFKRKKIIFLDRDGVVNVKPPKAKYVKSWKDWKWMPNIFEDLKQLIDNGFNIIIISNQAGIGRKIMSELDLKKIHEIMNAYLIHNGSSIMDIFYCPHDWDEGCFCRKPMAGLFFIAQKKYNINLAETYFIGDDSRDEIAAKKAGCKFFMVNKKQKLRDLVKLIVSKKNG